MRGDQSRSAAIYKSGVIAPSLPPYIPSIAVSNSRVKAIIDVQR